MCARADKKRQFRPSANPKRQPVCQPSANPDAKKKPGREAPVVSLDFPGSSSRQSGWNRALTGMSRRFSRRTSGSGRRRGQPFLAPSRRSWRPPPQPLKTGRPVLQWDLPWWSVTGLPCPLLSQHIAQVCNSMTVPGRHLQIRCITKLVSSLDSSSCRFYSSNGNAVVYLFLRNTKLVLTWCTALHGMMCSRNSFSYARMLLHTIFK